MPKESCPCAAWCGGSDECIEEKCRRSQLLQRRVAPVQSNLVQHKERGNHEEEKLQQQAHFQDSQAIRSAGSISPRTPSLLAERRRGARHLRRRHTRLDPATRLRQSRE